MPIGTRRIPRFKIVPGRPTTDPGELLQLPLPYTPDAGDQAVLETLPSPGGGGSGGSVLGTLPGDTAPGAGGQGQMDPLTLGILGRLLGQQQGMFGMPGQQSFVDPLERALAARKLVSTFPFQGPTKTGAVIWPGTNPNDIANAYAQTKQAEDEVARMALITNTLEAFRGALAGIARQRQAKQKSKQSGSQS